jgi:protein-disulfide isomerase-like protein with CxxC motif
MQKYGDLDSQGVMGAVNNLLTAFATNFQTLNNAAGQTLTVAQTVNVILLRSGAAAVTDTTPTAAAIVAVNAECRRKRCVPP